MSECPFCGYKNDGNTLMCPGCNYIAMTSWDGYNLPLSLGPFIFQENFFEYKNQKHNYQNIEHIDFESQVTRTFGPGRTIPWFDSEKAKLTLHIKNNISIKEKNTCFSLPHGTCDNPKLQHQKSVYSYLSKLSFNSRLNMYARDVSNHNYFTYDGAKFYTDGRIETRSHQGLSLLNWSIEDYGTFIQLVPRDPSLLNKLGKGLSNLPTNSAYWKKLIHSSSTIHTTTDKDVFYSLMFRIYKIRFSPPTIMAL